MYSLIVTFFLGIQVDFKVEILHDRSSNENLCQNIYIIYMYVSLIAIKL
jgi:hypothetical protein